VLAEARHRDPAVALAAVEVQRDDRELGHDPKA
jgi:hypothetical protein